MQFKIILYQISFLLLITSSEAFTDTIYKETFKVKDYKGIIALAPKINNSVVMLGSRSDAQDKNANNLIDLSYFYLGASYLMEGDIELGREALLFAKKRTKDKKFLKAINNYLLQVE